MRLKEIMTTPVVCVDPEDDADTAWSRMTLAGIRHLLVQEGPTLLGVLSERDLGGRKGRALRRGRTVRELMSPKAFSATPHTTLRQAANLMRGRLIGCLPVVEDGRVVGIVTATDVLDELGRGSSRPAAQAKRRAMRLPPSSAREARRKRARRRAPRSTKGSRKKGVAPGASRPIAGRNTPQLGRSRVRQPDSPKRAPFPARIARPDRRWQDRTAPSSTPAYIRAAGVTLDAADKDYIRRKLGRKLGKFAWSIERVSVRVEDVNGPRGGVDKRCRIKVVMPAIPSVVTEERHHSLQASMDRALTKAERAVRQAVQRHRTMHPKRRTERTRRAR